MAPLQEETGLKTAISTAVIVNKIEDDFLTLSKQLNKFTRNIDSRIEPVLIQNGNDRSVFLTTILETGITLYGS